MTMYRPIGCCSSCPQTPTLAISLPAVVFPGLRNPCLVGSEMHLINDAGQLVRDDGDERIDIWGSMPFLGMHLACLLTIWTGVSFAAVVVCLALYGVRMFAITAGYHRYFSHRSYKTSRSFQFVLGWLGTMAAQKGPLWWASHHRSHHRYSDMADDVHSPTVRGFWWSHV